MKNSINNESIEVKTLSDHRDLGSSESELKIKHEDLRNLLYWKGRTVIDWTEDDIKLGHLIRRLHYQPTTELTEDEKAVLGRVVLDRSKSEDMINDLSHLKMWIPKKPALGT